MKSDVKTMWGLLTAASQQHVGTSGFIDRIPRIAQEMTQRSLDVKVGQALHPRLPDGSRVNAVIPPLALDGPGLSIRRFGGHTIQIYDMTRHHSLTTAMAEEISRLPIGVSIMTGGGLQMPLMVEVRPRETKHGGESVKVIED